MQVRFCFSIIAAMMLGSPVKADDGYPPSIPQSVIVEPISSTTIDISWHPSSDPDGVKQYNIYKNGEFTGSTSDIRYRDTNVSPNAKYHYWVTSIDGSGKESSTSKWIYTRTPVASSAEVATSSDRPGAPVDVSASLQSDGGVRLDWRPGEDPSQIEGYNIYRNRQYIQTVKEASYTDYGSDLSNSVEYSIVNYTWDKQFSTHSNPAEIVSSDVAPPPNEKKDDEALDHPNLDRVTGVFSSVHSGSSLTLYWDKQSGADGYNVYRDNAYITTVRNESYTDHGLSAEQNYQYSVVAFTDDNQFAVHSDSHSVTTGVSDSTQRIRPLDATDGRSATTRAAIGDDYQLVFSDEFNAYELDLSKWNTAYLWGPDLTTNNESQYYVDIARNPDFGYHPFSGNGEHLSIKADRTPDWLRNSANGKPYLSGVMTSYDSFQFTYGYAEARLRAPAGNGFFSAFWLLNARYIDIEPEIDITELLGESPYVVHHTYHHYDAGDNLISTPTFDTYLDDFSKEFHTYAVRWSPGEIVWYVDGVERQRVTEGAIAAQPMYVLFNLAIDGDWPKSPDESTVFPSALEIDYVRVYQK